jgi:hypothetical protein
VEERTVTLVVQHAEAKSGKRVTVSVLTSDVTAGHTALARRGRRPRLPGGAKLCCIAGASDGFGSGMVCTKNPDQPATEASWSGGEWAGLGLLLADDLPVDVDVIQHHDAGAGFRSAVMDKVDALHLATRRDGRNSLRRVGRIEA